MGEFDIQAARNAGLSDEEIAGELAKHHNYDLSAAINAGHSYTDVANELASQPMQHPRGEYEGDPVEAAVIGGALGATGSTAKGTVKTGYDIIHRLVNGPKKVETPVVEPSPAEAAPVVEDPAVQPIDIPAEPTAAELAGKEKWNAKLTGASVPGSQMDAASLAKNRDLMKAAHEMGGSLSNEGILLGPKDTHANRVAEDALKRARQARVESALKDAHLAEEARMSAKLKAEQAARAAQAAQEASIPGRAKAVLTGAQKVAKPVTNVISKIGSIPLLGPTLATAGTLGEAQDAYNRAQHGDYGRSLISGLGAIGSAASALAPTPATKGIGGAASIAAPAINALIDKYYGREGYADGGPVLSYPMGGGLNYTMPGFAEGGGLAQPKKFADGKSTGSPSTLDRINSLAKKYLPQDLIITGNEYHNWLDSVATPKKSRISSYGKLLPEYSPEIPYPMSKYGTNLTSMPGNYLPIYGSKVSVGNPLNFYSHDPVAGDTDSSGNITISRPVTSKTGDPIGTLIHEAQHGRDILSKYKADDYSKLVNKDQLQKQDDLISSSVSSKLNELAADTRYSDPYLLKAFTGQSESPEVIAQLKEYEARLPAGMTMFQSPLGKDLFKDNASKTWYLTHTTDSMSSPNFQE